jgi:RNA polymerase sigma-70 factor (ECF subfamily)
LKFHQHVELKNVMEDATLQEDALSIMSAKELLSVIQQLPVGYRTIFNLYVIEAHRHDEIAQMLGISEGTSKSQLFRARAYVRNILKKLER